ncbi:hypothetical protein KEM56_003028 [Ascosphaera pollenicola]|nr:hypothetical protein KEM56_003028 [Ascosphaera pollenicola]
MAEAHDLARRCWARLGARAEDQAVVFLGETGSGKTTIRSHLLSSFLSFSSTPLSQKLSYAAFVFDTLTTTKSVTTPTASKSGLFFELQYDASSTLNPTLIGGKILDHRLERSRLTAVPTGERSFHVLYYLLAGTSPEEKEHLGLHDDAGAAAAASAAAASAAAATGNLKRTLTRKAKGTGHKRWRYLGHPTQLKVGIKDDEGFTKFRKALRKLEFSQSDIAQISQVLACILHIGQLQFTTGQATTTGADESGGYSHEGGETVTVVKNKDTLSIVAAFMGLSLADLELCLANKSKTIRRERVTVMLDPVGARENADNLATTLYSLLVAYVMESINSRSCAREDAVANTISIVDFPGFSHAANPAFVLDQLFNNAANESLHNFCLRSFFDSKADMLETEEIVVGPTSYFDNTDTVKGLTKPGIGVLSILDEQTRKGRTDGQFLEALRKRLQGKVPSISVGSPTEVLPGSNFPTRTARATFTVQHYAGPVDYPVDGLVEENGEVVSADLINLVKSTQSPFIRDLFGTQALSTIVHPQDRNAILQAQLSSKPQRMPSLAARKHAAQHRRPGLVQRSSTSRLSRHGTVIEDGESEFGVNGGGDDDGDDAAAAAAVAESEQKKRKKSTSGHAATPSTATGITQGAAGQFLSSLDNVTKSLMNKNCNPYFIFCLKPNDRRIANQFDSMCVRTQMQTFGIPEISQRLKNADVSVFLPFAEFLGLAEVDSLIVGTDKEKTQVVVDEKRWPSNEALVGSTGIFLSERCWFDVAKLTDRLASVGEPGASTGDLLAGGAGPSAFDSRARLLGDGFIPDDHNGAYVFGEEGKHGYLSGRELDARSDAGTSIMNSGGMFQNMETREQMAEKGNAKKMEEVDELPQSSSRKRWLFLVWFLTWWIPDFAVRIFGRMPRKDIRLAWREKFAINMLIWFFCLVACFYIIGFPLVICPTQHVYSTQELSSNNGQDGAKAFLSIRGRVFDLDKFLPHHYVVDSVIPSKQIKNYAGKDATGLFPIQVSALCMGVDGPVDPTVVIDYQPANMSGTPVTISQQDTNWQYHDFRYFNDDYRPDWYYEQMHYLQNQFMKGHVGYTSTYMQTLVSEKNRYMSSINGFVYDMTDYVNGNIQLKDKPGNNNKKKRAVNKNFLDENMVNLFRQNPGDDISKLFQGIEMTDQRRSQQLQCLNNLFMIGKVDNRNSARCRFAEYLILIISACLASIIAFKFFAALQFTKKNVPENLDRFVICQVPVYTEDEESLRRAIDSMARMRYDDKRKLLVVICDGMIIGQGNDRPTPRIVLDILGVSETVDPEPLSFESLGEGQKQHNMGKVYSGLYEVQGHIVPFLVVVKVGKPSEVSRPGNRGKRDSQMVMMRFLNRVHYNAPMTPLELEMHHHIRNIIGVNPTFYEFILQVDADTEVAPDAATRMVAALLADIRILGLCGETALTNARASITTSIQVYEYYISHNLTKAFESLFGSVTCLPGCFTMYRIRATDTGKPLFVSKEVVEQYAEIRVDTLHMKNLLHLGEDRYLTTLLIKHHPEYKTKFLFNAFAYTVAPDSFSVFLSQRRRWINSTVHNLVELVPMSQLCGFCCFSMRFIVFIDLISTAAQPVIMVYIVYLIVKLCTTNVAAIWMSFLLLAVIYGLQAMIFLLHRKWDMIGWMFIYLLATPIFSFALPLYSFWHMDDFSWGNTRVVTGEKGQKVVVSDEGKFDPATIPKKKWDEYQNELWETQSGSGYHDDLRSESGMSFATRSYHPAMSSQPPTDPLIAYQPSAYGLNHRYNSSKYSVSQAGGHEMEMADLSHLPSDDQILYHIRDILSTADLMTITKKSVKDELERRFMCNLDAKRHYINSATEAILSGQI